MAQTVNWCRVWLKETTVFLIPPPCWSSWTPSTTLPVAGQTLCLRSVQCVVNMVPNKNMITNWCNLTVVHLATNNKVSGTCRGHPGGWGVERSSSNLKVGSSIPSIPHLHAEVYLSKMLNPELCLIEQQSAANRCTVWMCVWMGECKTVLHYINTNHLLFTCLTCLSQLQHLNITCCCLELNTS